MKQSDVETTPAVTGSDGSREEVPGRAESCPPFLEPERRPVTLGHDHPLLSRRYIHFAQPS